MKFAFLVLANLRRKPVRTVLTGMSLIVAFLLFGLLEPVVQLFESGSRVGDSSRWWVAPRHSISDMLPVRYHQQIQGLAGVETAAHQTWFGGVYIDAASSSAFTRWAVSPEEFLNINPQIVLDEDQRAAFLATRTGAIVGRSIADRFQMKVGDKIPITADIWHNADGSEWTFDLVGIYDSPPDEKADTSRFLVNYGFFDEYRVVGKGLISNVVFTVNEGVSASQITALIDEQYSNSEMETITTSESDYVLNQISQLGNIGLILRSVMGAVLFTILLLTTNTMSQAVHERRGEIATLRALGFLNNNLIILTLVESLVLTVTAALIGLAIAEWLLQFTDLLVPQITTLELGTITGLLGISVAAILAIVVSLPPALSAVHLSIADALRH